MKVFLCGGGAGEQTAAAVKRLNEVIDNKKPLLYIPLAMERELYDSCYEWVSDELDDLDIPRIDMIRSGEELYKKELSDYSALFIGGGNTFKLLKELKDSGTFERIRLYLKQGGVVFGGSAGAIIFGEDLEPCALEDPNDVNLVQTDGFNILGGISLLCHYTNGAPEETERARLYLLELSKRKRVIALPEEVTLFVNGSKLEIIGDKAYYAFENGKITEIFAS